MKMVSRGSVDGRFHIPPNNTITLLPMFVHRTQNTITHTQGLPLTQDPAPPIEVGVADEFGGVKHTKDHRNNQEDCAQNVADLFDNESGLCVLDTNVPA